MAFLSRISLLILVGIASGMWEGSVCKAEEQRPVGWVRHAEKDARIILHGTRTGAAVQTGDFIFSGDRLDGGSGVLQFVYCPDANSSQGGLYELRDGLELPESGGLPFAPFASTDRCLLPELERRPQTATIPSPDQLHVKHFSAAEMAASVAKLPEETRRPIERLLGAGVDPERHLAAAVRLESTGRYDEAASEYWEAATQWPSQPRLWQHIQRLVEAPKTFVRSLNEPEETRQNTAKGKVFALVVGISHYEQPNLNAPDLQFAVKDAKKVEEYLKSPRGGNADVKLLPDAGATSGAIRNEFLALKRKAGKNDTVWLYVAAHGDMLPQDKGFAPQTKVPSIITHRADPQDVTINSFPLSEVENWMLGKTSPFGRAMIFLDLCHAGQFVRFRKEGTPVKSVFGIMATNVAKTAVAYEHPIFDGGHGAFTYFLLRGLNTNEAREAGDSWLRAPQLESYVVQNVQQVTRFRQSPTPLGEADPNERIADLNLRGIEMKQIPLKDLRIPDRDLNSKTPNSKARQRNLGIAEDNPQRVSVPEPDPQLRTSIDLENQGEQILLDYLKGEEVPQTRQEFRRGAGIFAAALMLQNGSPYLNARELFCIGRVSVFLKKYDAGIRALEESIRLEPTSAYAYNALGIARLERGEYQAAENAFQDAIDRAPRWAYPRHNLALVHWQQGRYNLAIADYREALSRASTYFYLPYNLGLLYAKLNRQDEAQDMYRLAIQRAPGRAEPLTALAQLQASQGNRRGARKTLEKALALPGQFDTATQAARHNYAMLLADDKKTFAKAVDFWQQNGDYLPSRFSMAEALSKRGDTAGAISEYRQILTLAPESIAARMELASELESQRAPISEVVDVLGGGVSGNAANPILLERLGLAYRRAGNEQEARAAWKTALENTKDPATRARIQKLLEEQ